MDWFKIASQDWYINQDTSRIANYVVKGKITPDQYKEITGDPYTATA